MERKGQICGTCHHPGMVGTGWDAAQTGIRHDLGNDASAAAAAAVFSYLFLPQLSGLHRSTKGRRVREITPSTGGVVV